MVSTQGWIIGLHLWSTHFGACYEQALVCKPYAAATQGIYWRAPSGLTVGGFRNSYGGDSAYAGWTFETQDGRFALMVGGVTGYRRAAVLPIVAPSVRFELGAGVALRVAGLPKAGHSAAPVLHLALERRL